MYYYIVQVVMFITGDSAKFESVMHYSRIHFYEKEKDPVEERR